MIVVVARSTFYMATRNVSQMYGLWEQASTNEFLCVITRGSLRLNIPMRGKATMS